MCPTSSDEDAIQGFSLWYLDNIHFSVPIRGATCSTVLILLVIRCGPKAWVGTDRQLIPDQRWRNGSFYFSPTIQRM